LAGARGEVRADFRDGDPDAQERPGRGLARRWITQPRGHYAARRGGTPAVVSSSAAAPPGRRREDDPDRTDRDDGHRKQEAMPTHVSSPTSTRALSQASDGESARLAGSSFPA